MSKKNKTLLHDSGKLCLGQIYRADWKGGAMDKDKGDLTFEEVEKYLTFPEERLIVAKRKHWFVLVPEISTAALVALLILLFVFFPAYFLLSSLELFLSAALLIFSLTISFITKMVVDSYFHIYVVTNRKILEVICRPFFTDTINDVFLDQVRTTEVDVRMNGIVNEVLNMGDVVIAFDRASHDKEFILKDIKDPRNTGNLIGDELKSIMYATPIWFQPRDKITTDNGNGQYVQTPSIYEHVPDEKKAIMGV
jgi:hypothetical protein